MKKGLREAFIELGKHFFNIAVAIIVFAVLQPLIRGNINIKVAIIFSIIYFALVTTATILIIIGGSKSE